MLTTTVNPIINYRSQLLHDRLGICLKLIVSSESISCHEFASQFGLEFVLYAKKTKPIVNTEYPHVVYVNGSPTGHCLAGVESGAPNHDGLIGRTDTANMGGGGGVRVRECERVCACVRACAMCLQYTIMIFYPG